MKLATFFSRFLNLNRGFFFDDLKQDQIKIHTQRDRESELFSIYVYFVVVAVLSTTTEAVQVVDLRLQVHTLLF